MRRLVLVLVAVAVVAVVALAGVGWYFSSNLLTPNHQLVYDLPVRSAADGQVALAARRDAVFPGRYDIRWDGGLAVVGDVVTTDGVGAEGTVVRTVEQETEGELAAAQQVYWGQNIYTGDPKTSVGLEFTDVDVEGPLGGLPAWYVPGAPGRPWVVAVHGINGSREDFLRVMPFLHEAGYPVLAVSYRNDVVAPPSPDGLHHLGDTEWEDVDAALAWARAQGATDVVLLAQSMGGAIALQQADRGEHRDLVRALVLDSPVVDWDDTLHWQGGQRGAPGFVVDVAQLVVRLRISIDFDRFDWVERADDIAVPVMVLHGPDDTYVPWGPAVELAEARPSDVTLVEIRQAEHVRGWNVEPGLYEASVLAFLQRAVA